jgi:hypothetical protein
MKKCHVSWDEKERVLTFPVPGATRRLFARGLTKSLSAQFSPEFSISLVLKSLNTIKKKKHGRFRGNLADQQLSTWANEGILPGLNMDSRFDYIRNIIVEKEWIPVCAQLPVGCKELRLATKIDLLCRDAQGKIIIIELKCGFDDYFEVHNQGNMSYPLQHVPTSFRNKSILQLLLSTYFFFHTEHRFNRYTFGGSYLLHVYESPNGTLMHTLEPLPFWAFSSTDLIQQLLLLLKQSKNQNKRKRVQLMQNGSSRVRYRFNKKTKS